MIKPIKKKSPNSTTLHLVQSSRFARRLAKLLLVGLVLSVLGMAFLPWQQTSQGTGQVVAYAPQERQQVVKAPTKGVIARIADGLVEGSVVEKGDFLVDIQPFAANMVEQLKGQLEELKIKEQAADAKAEACQENVNGFTEAFEFTVEAAEDLVASARAKLKSKQKQVSAYKAKQVQKRLNYERQKSLFEQGLKPQKEIEKLEREWEVAKADLASILEDIISLEKEVDAKVKKREEQRRLAKTKIDYAKALLQDALGSAATIRKDIRDVEIKLGEINRREVVAPRSGTIFRLNVNEQGDTVKEGDALLILVPDTDQKAVELFVNGNDMPLVQLGQEVRLQFEGWPAVQFAGWPSVAVGTFGGTVSTVDATDNGKGEFRILVSPNGNDQAWPSDRYLRQGVRANGWVMLNQVSLGYEIWRQLNGFPVILSEKEPDKKDIKKPKLPK